MNNLKITLGIIISFHISCLSNEKVEKPMNISNIILTDLEMKCGEDSWFNFRSLYNFDSLFIYPPYTKPSDVRFMNKLPQDIGVKFDDTKCLVILKKGNKVSYGLVSRMYDLTALAGEYDWKELDSASIIKSTDSKRFIFRWKKSR